MLALPETGAVVTDALLVARLAQELDERLRGSRLQDAGLADDGRTALAFAGQPEPLILDPFASPPAVLFEPARISIEGDPGYLRAIATTLRGMRVAGVTAVPEEDPRARFCGPVASAWWTVTNS